MFRRLARHLLAPSAPSPAPPAQPPPLPIARAFVAPDTPNADPTAEPAAAHAPGPLPVGPNPPNPQPPSPQLPDQNAASNVVLVDLPGLLAALHPGGRPLLVHHWASWDGPSTAGLPAVAALVARHDLRAVSIVWDALTDAPMGRIAAMAQRTARWADGVQAEAWARQAGIGWPQLVYEGPPDALFDTLALSDRWIPQITYYTPDGAVLAHHGGPLSGPEWERFATSIGQAATQTTTQTASAPR